MTDTTAPLLSEDYLRLKHWRHGLILFNVNDYYIGRSLDLYGESQENELAFLGRIVKPGQAVLDIGSNIGTHAVFLARCVGPKGRVIAFEPQRPMYHILCANLALNKLGNVSAFHSGVGAEQGTMKVPPIDYSRPNNFGGISFADVTAGETVPMVTVDALRLKRCDMMKIDVEGFEYNVLRGAAKTIQRFRPLLLVENQDQEHSAKLIGLLRSMGYRLYWHLPRLWNKDNYYGVKENIYGDTLCINMFGIHETSKTEVRNMPPVKGPQDRPIYNSPRPAVAPWEK